MNYTKNWAVRRNKDTYQLINEYFATLNNRRYASNGRWPEDTDEGEIWHNYDFLIFPHISRSTFVVQEIPSGYKEISFEEFKQHILKIKPKYYELY